MAMLMWGAMASAQDTESGTGDSGSVDIGIVGAFDYLAMAAIAAPIVLALVEAAKGAGLPSKWAAFAAIGFGVVITFLLVAADSGITSENWAEAILAGILGGLSAAGLYSGTQAVRRSP